MPLFFFVHILRRAGVKNRLWGGRFQGKIIDKRKVTPQQNNAATPAPRPVQLGHWRRIDASSIIQSTRKLPTCRSLRQRRARACQSEPLKRCATSHHVRLIPPPESILESAAGLRTSCVTLQATLSLSCPWASVTPAAAPGGLCTVARDPHPHPQTYCSAGVRRSTKDPGIRPAVHAAQLRVEWTEDEAAHLQVT